MQKVLPPHSKFRIAESYFLGGILSNQGSTRYGAAKLLRFRDAAVLFNDERLWKAYSSQLQPARPVHTAMKTIALKVPLGDVLVKDGKQAYVVIEEGPMYDITKETIQVDEKLLTAENLSKPSQLIVAEEKWVTTGKNKVFETRMLEGNDQRSIAMPQMGRHKMTDILNLVFSERELNDVKLVQDFLKEYGNVTINLCFHNEVVVGGLASTGGAYGFLVGLRESGALPLGLLYRAGALVYDTGRVEHTVALEV